MKNVIVLFEVTIRDGKMDSYLEAAASLKESLENAEGFLKSERFSSLNETGKLSVCPYGKMKKVLKNGEIWRPTECARSRDG